MDMRTKEKLHEEMGSLKHDWQTKKLIRVEDLSFVIQNLLTNKFVVEINENMYDIAFGIKRKKIAYGWSSSPSPHLKSFEIIEKAFREGKWFIIEDEDNV
ncbi:hypothetical protein IAQ67_15820 [Paenibacillus peoriae]|uniref:Uncharacterized protein n=1 Tax=Paenibacillus peoriae TaxID=59893 RepID=A0A7H0Y2Q4_9BACL|nr:hypothetical protein [Paenibacillus peoriae]QNR65362.1 hypothetical protein IAQ67_15820 [Paenibacillus peoriae]